MDESMKTGLMVLVTDGVVEKAEESQQVPGASM